MHNFKHLIKNDFEESFSKGPLEVEFIRVGEKRTEVLTKITKNGKTLNVALLFNLPVIDSIEGQAIIDSNFYYQYKSNILTALIIGRNL